MRAWPCLVAIAALATAGCGPDSGTESPPPLHATVSASAGTCPGAQSYQHATLEYRVCYPAGWITRDYTSEPGSGGALSVVAFGPAEKVPQRIPSGVEYAPPLDVRVIAGPKSTIEPSLAQGERIQAVTPTSWRRRPAATTALSSTQCSTPSCLQPQADLVSRAPGGGASIIWTWLRLR